MQEEGWIDSGIVMQEGFSEVFVRNWGRGIFWIVSEIFGFLDEIGNSVWRLEFLWGDQLCGVGSSSCNWFA